MWGASTIEKEVAKKIPDPNLRIYVVWMPILPTDIRPPGQAHVDRVPDPRATHYWDSKAKLSQIFRDVLLPRAGFGTRPVVWDAYMLYGPDAEWTAAPPKPPWWFQQMKGHGQALNGADVAGEARRLLEQLGTPSSR